jgi:hypothetical protein
MKKVVLSIMLVFILITSVFSMGYAADSKVADSQRLKDLAAVRRATAKYHDVQVAIDAGYIPTEVCVSGPGGAAMGYHYVNPSLAMDPAISLTEPEVLLYAPNDEGGIRLVGVEYFFAIGAPGTPVPPNPPPAPLLFGRAFDGPMLGHDPDMPPHYDLHVWVWQANPDGIFALFNRNISCP